jgi:cold shock CspA family protein
MTAKRGHETPTAAPRVAEQGVVTNLFPAEEYGLLRAADGRELPFHRESADGEFEHLNLGTAVRFREELTERGPEAVDVALAR